MKDVYWDYVKALSPTSWWEEPSGETVTPMSIIYALLKDTETGKSKVVLH